jgi:hypothetical protein
MLETSDAVAVVKEYSVSIVFQYTFAGIEGRLAT